MNRQETIEKILEAMKINDSQIGLLGKILDLQSDKKIVHSLSLSNGTIGHMGLYLEVLLVKNFKDSLELGKYLDSQGIYVKTIRTRLEPKSYYIIDGKLKIEFIKPDFYTKKG